jgi:hypothetical protein
LRGQAEGKGANRTACPDHAVVPLIRCADLRYTQVIEARFALTGKVCLTTVTADNVGQLVHLRRHHPHLKPIHFRPVDQRMETSGELTRTK